MVQTYPVAPSIALASMACELADRRCAVPPSYSAIRNRQGHLPVPREVADTAFPASREFYRILDRLSRGEQP